MHKGFSDLPVLLANCCQFDLQTLLKNPAQLGAFLSLSKIIKDLEPEIQTTAITLALQGTEIPGYTLVRHQTPGYIDTETLKELIASCPLARMPALLDAITEMLGHISGDRYRRLCTVIGISPQETAIKHAGANPLLRQNA